MKIISAIISAIKETVGQIKLWDGSGRSDETFSNHRMLQHYGFTSKPLSGAQAVVLMEGNQIIVIAEDDVRYRFVLDDGEVALYNDQGLKVHLKVDGTIELGGTTFRKLIDERFKVLFDAHVHPDPVSGITGVPTVLLDLALNATEKVKAG